MAYAGGHELPYHTDYTSLSHPPDIQYLYMTTPAKEGGLSMFVDGFMIAEELRANHKWAYDILKSTKIEFIEVGYDVHDRDGNSTRFDYHMTARKTTIR